MCTLACDSLLPQPGLCGAERRPRLHCGLLRLQCPPQTQPPALPLLPRKTTPWFLRQEVQLQAAPPAVLSERLAHLSFLQDLPIPDALSRGGWLAGGGETPTQPLPHLLGAQRQALAGRQEG